jgi:kumamolisin
MSKSRVILAGTKRTPIPNSQPIIGPGDRPDPNEIIEVTVSLRRKEQIPEWVRHVGIMSKEQIASDYGTSASDFMALQKFAEEFNLQVIEENAFHCIAKLSGNVQNLEKAFGTKLRHVRVGDKVHRERIGHLTVPEELSSIILGVFGLDNRPAARPLFRPLVGHAAHAFDPPQVAKLYNFPSGDGSGETIAIIELDGGYKLNDLNTYFSGLGISTPNITAVSVDGATNNPKPAPPPTPQNPNPLDPDGEVLLDIEVAGAIAPKAKINVYFTPNNDKGFLDAINKAIQDKPTVISISWGDPESKWTSASMNSFESAFQNAAALSIPVAVASGDNGSTDGTASLAVDFPASAPHALGCGGTHLEGTNSITSEVVWNSSGATGGGVSNQFKKPSYQNSVTVPPPSNANGGRGVPDISGDAAPETGYNIRRDGQNLVFGGTSAVAPLWSALIALLAQNLGHRVPFLNPILYDNPNASRDITNGNNDLGGTQGGKFAATTGWDPCTGMGSPNGAALLAALKGVLTTSTVSTTHTTTKVTTPTTTHTSPHTTTTHTSPTSTSTQTSPTVTGSSGGTGVTTGALPAVPRWYPQIPPPIEPQPVAPILPPVQAAPVMGVYPGGVVPSSDAQVAMLALSATVANVANTAITAITSITAIAVNGKK